MLYDIVHEDNSSYVDVARFIYNDAIPVGMWTGRIFNWKPSSLSIFSEFICHLVTTPQDSAAIHSVPQYIRRTLARHKVPILVLMPKSAVLLAHHPEQFIPPPTSKDRSTLKNNSRCKLVLGNHMHLATVGVFMHEHVSCVNMHVHV